MINKFISSLHGWFTDTVTVHNFAIMLTDIKPVNQIIVARPVYIASSSP